MTGQTGGDVLVRQALGMMERRDAVVEASSLMASVRKWTTRGRNTASSSASRVRQELIRKETRGHWVPEPDTETTTFVGEYIVVDYHIGGMRWLPNQETGIDDPDVPPEVVVPCQFFDENDFPPGVCCDRATGNFYACDQVVEADEFQPPDTCTGKPCTHYDERQMQSECQAKCEAELPSVHQQDEAEGYDWTDYETIGVASNCHIVTDPSGFGCTPAYSCNCTHTPLP